MIPGIDVSHWQGGINFNLVKNAGYKFVIAKASEGIHFVDRRFNENLVHAQDEGLVAGAYHFLRSDSDPEVQANHFIETVGRTEGILCALDVESSASSAPTISQVYKFAHIFKQRSRGHPLIIYTGRWYWAGHMGNPQGNTLGPLWHSAYRQDPGPLYGGWKRFTFWQYSSTGVIPGINAHTDLNWFYGGMNELHALTVVDPPINVPDEGIPEMMVVQNKATGAALHLLGGNAALLVENTAHLKQLVAAGLPFVACEQSQFSRYEKMRIDDNKPNPE